MSKINSTNIIKEQSKLSRGKYGKLGGWISIILNSILFVIKGVLGLWTGSLALVADAFHTLSDMATSLIVVISFYISEKPSDKEHPFGHGRAEFISAIIMSTILAVSAIELLKYSIDRILDPVDFLASWWIILIIFITVLFKEGLAIFSRKLSKKIKSDTLMADAWHHHLDAISSVLVIGAFVFTNFGLPNIDGIIGVLITIIIIYSAYKIAKSPIDHLLGKSPDSSLLSQIENITLKMEGVKGLHDVIIHNYGHITIISLHIEIDENITFKEAHSIAENVDKILSKELDAYITIHYDPVMERTDLYQSLEAAIKEFCLTDNDCDSFHDLRIYGKENQLRLAVDLVSDRNVSSYSDSSLIDRFKVYMQKRIPGLIKISTKVEPKFSISRKSRQD